MAKIYLSDKQLPAIPSEAVLDALLELTKRATPGERNVQDIGLVGSPASPSVPNFHLTTSHGLPLGRHDAELAATCTPELVRGLLYKIALLADARTEACHLLQDHWGSRTTPAQAAKLAKLLNAGES
ncbi:MAG: hypothetical protein EPN91_00495 [Salinibacterium sp.]|nr:MAG: hypothetical protein EPN91_00495 [Salinibacterium sp.]